MSMSLLRRGSQGNAVKELQELLNENLPSGPKLPINGVFGPRTEQAVLRFQKENWLTEDGLVGPCTLNALRGTETYKILHRVHLVTQPTGTTCWAASTAMILGLLAPVKAPPFMLLPDGSLFNDSKLHDPVVSSHYCLYYGLTMHHAQSWSPSGLAAIMQRGPVMCNVLWNIRGYLTRTPPSPEPVLPWVGSNSHWVVFAGIRGDGTIEGTTIRIYDPLPGELPKARGHIYSLIYGPLVKRLPGATYQLFHR
jgi:hypothetical protein